MLVHIPHSKESSGCWSGPAASHCLSVSSTFVNSTFATTLGHFFSTQATKSLPFLCPSVQYLHSESPLVAWCSFVCTLIYVYRLCHAFSKHRAITYTSRIWSIYDYFSRACHVTLYTHGYW